MNSYVQAEAQLADACCGAGAVTGWRTYEGPARMRNSPTEALAPEVSKERLIPTQCPACDIPCRMRKGGPKAAPSPAGSERDARREIAAAFRSSSTPSKVGPKACVFVIGKIQRTGCINDGGLH
jgi:hypothetical protein